MPSLKFETIFLRDLPRQGILSRGERGKNSLAKSQRRKGQCQIFPKGKNEIGQL